MKWLWRRLLGMRPSPDGQAAAQAQTNAEEKLRVSRQQARHVRREMDRFTQEVQRAMRGHPT